MEKQIKSIFKKIKVNKNIKRNCVKLEKFVDIIIEIFHVDESV